ncbi:MAG TPA: hypothetical protein VII23_16530 [Terriglobales bacterium]
MTNNYRRILWIAMAMLALCAASYAQIGVGIAVSFGPPALPIYEQPLCPGDGYLWTPGYWAYYYDYGDYYWVPGTWILAPEVGLLWTPGWWGWGGEGFIFHEGYWGPQVGFYGGINYGYGYFGEGYQGGRWDHDRFFYNRAVNNVNVTNVRNVYNTTVVNNNTVNRVSYNGGNGGITARPTPQDEGAARAKRLAPVPAQTQQVQAARSNQDLRASVNRGKPPVAATQKPGDFKGQAVVPAKQAGGTYNPPPNRAAAQSKPNPQAARTENTQSARPENNTQTARPQNNTQAARPENNNNAARPNTAVHPNDLPPIERSAAPSNGNEANQKYQQQQEQLHAQQQQERQKLQQQQEQEHQQMAQQKANEARQQQMEQQHQQQTEKLQQQHAQQQQQLARQQQQQTQAKQQPQRNNQSKPPQ